jgi:hypothetical protein
MNYNRDVMSWNEFPACDLIWTDCPWENKMVKFFQTQLKKDTGEDVNHTLEEIINHFAKTALKTIPIVMEYSIKGHELIVEIMESNGHKLISKNEGMQSMNRPFILLVFNKDIKIDTSEKGRNIIINSLKNTNFNVVFDCFAGIGFTASAVREAGKIYIGSELNKKRYEKLCKVNV